ncbi:MAG: hypothetical protein AAGL98_00735 [Planctomycetota bacterium]
MVTDREAKVWMVAALAVFVWACTMVGCVSSVPAPGSYAGLEPQLQDTFTVPGESADAMEVTPIVGDFTAIPLAITAGPAADAWGPEVLMIGEPLVATASSLMMAELAPAAPDLIRLRPRRVPVNLDLGLSGLSIAYPLLSAKRLLVAGVTQLHRLPRPVNDTAALRIVDADAGTRPIAAALATEQQVEILSPKMELDTPVELAGLVLEQPAWLIRGNTTPSPPRPLPSPVQGAALTAEEAKFDSAGVIGMVLGAMVLLFGGEAIVLWMLDRHQAAAKIQLRDALADDAADTDDDQEVSIFRLPEPAANQTSQDTPRSRAA